MEFAAEMTVEREGRSNTSENNTVDAAGNPAISFYDSATIQVALLFSQFSSLFFWKAKENLVSSAYYYQLFVTCFKFLKQVPDLRV